MPVVALEDSPDVVAIVPTMLDARARLLASIDGVRANADLLRVAILCIVNSSTARPDASYPSDVRFEVAGVNLGWAGGLSFGIAISSSPFVWFVQDDMIASPGALNTLRAALGTNPDLGLASPVVIDTSGFVVAGTAGGNLTESGAVANWIPAQTVPPSELTGMAAPSYVPSRGMLLRRTALDAAGPPDARLYPVQFVDVDLCLRLRKAGFGISLVPEAHVSHLGGASTSRGSAQFLHARNAARVHHKHFADQPVPDDPYFEVASLRPDPVDAVPNPRNAALPDELLTAVAQSAADTLTHLGRIFTRTLAERETLDGELETLAAESAAESAAASAAQDEAHRYVTSLEEAKAAIEADRDNVLRQLIEAQAQLAAVKSSLSWRVTAPLRRVRGRLRP